MIYADLILKNGKIISMDAHDSIYQALAVKFGRIIAVGSNVDIKKYSGDETKIIDLIGKTVIPGLIDSHGHFINEGSSKEIYVDLSEEAGVHSISDIQEILKEKARQIPIGKWIFGYQEDDSKLKEKRHPYRSELDEISVDHPILITTVGGHFWMANSLRPEGPPQPTRSQSYRGAKQILSVCSSVGLTCIYDLVGKAEIRAAIDMKNNQELPIRVRMDITIELLNELDKLGIYRGLGDNWIRICGIKFFFDGAVSARTAAVSEPYLDKPNFYGVMATTEEIATKLLTKAYKKGYRISAHANGDRAITLYLDILEELQKKFPREDARNRDIHCSVINETLVRRIKELNVLPTIFGAYPYYHGDKLIPSFGTERLENMFAARSFLDANVMVAAHSLKLYTINAAYHSFDEEILGSIEPNKLADFAVLGEDILTINPERIKDIPIFMTIINGKIIYQKK
jgi:predicted amidohydrolase YtcJ